MLSNKYPKNCVLFLSQAIMIRINMALYEGAVAWSQLKTEIYLAISHYHMALEIIQMPVMSDMV